MSELTDPLSAWEGLLVRAGSVPEDELAELRSHLAESISDLVRVGLSEEEATLIAIRRMGDPAALAAEYFKVIPGVALTDRLYWGALGLVGFSIALGAVRLLSHAGTWFMRGHGPADPWFMGLGFFGISLLFLSVARTTLAPHGRIASAVKMAVTRAQERPVATAHLAFSALAGLTILDYFARGFIWSIAWPDGYAVRSLLEAVLTTGVPIGLFLLTGYLNRSDAMDRGSVGDADRLRQIHVIEE